MAKHHVLIAGAGIGGLTAALALRKRGHEVTLLERAHRLEPLGVGINLLPHAVRELDELGLGDHLASISMAPSAIAFYAASGQLLFRESRGIEGGYSHPQLSVHRGRLQLLLLDAVHERLGAAALRTDAAVGGLTQTGAGVTAHTSHGDVAADALIGADGINSAVRAALHPDDGPLLSAGVRMFRGAARLAPFLDGHTMAIIKGDKGMDLVTYSISDDQVNWVLQVPDGAPGPRHGDAGWNRPADRDSVAALVEGWHLGWLDAADLVRRTDEVFEYPMVDKDPLRCWGAGRVTLLGDAAHPMYPVGANGGSQAIVDARVLADELAGDLEAGLRRYEDRRIGKTADVVAANRDMHRAGTTRNGSQLADVSSKYRTDTQADRRHA